MEGAVKKFFSSPRFAVAGASSDTAKFGHKVFAWYTQHNLPVTPINPSIKQVAVAGKRSSTPTKHTSVPAPSALTTPAKTSLSVITPPAVTRKLLQDAKQAGIAAVWLQPGSFDKEILEWARKEWPGAAVAGTDVPGSRGGDGWCVLVDGEWGMSVAGRSSEQPESAKL